MHSWQNGTRCRDGVNVLWCRSHLVWLVFEGSIPTFMHLFSFGKLSVTCSCCFLFIVFFLEIVREKRGRQGEDAWFVKYESIELCCSQRTKNRHKSKCFQVKL